MNNRKKIYVALFVCVSTLFLRQLWIDNDHMAAHANTIHKVILQSLYLDGEMSEEVVFKEMMSAEEIMQEYAEWSIVIQTDKELVFQKHIDDISPLLKVNGYFGLSEEGTLSIFNGRPNESHIIQSFFQIDVEMLETKIHNDLVEGIRIKDKQHYEEVLEVFESYQL